MSPTYLVTKYLQYFSGWYKEALEQLDSDPETEPESECESMSNYTSESDSCEDQPKRKMPDQSMGNLFICDSFYFVLFTLRAQFS